LHGLLCGSSLGFEFLVKLHLLTLPGLAHLLRLLRRDVGISRRSRLL
jgi:hypothetical protein